jgi:hypothetical protein
MKLKKSQLKILNSELLDLKQTYAIKKSEVAKAINTSPSQLSQYLNHGVIPEDKYKDLLIIITNKSI